jgi:gliding motility-associated-like protein
MNNEHNPIDELFRNGLKDSGITPPPGVWEAVSSSMHAAAAPGVASLIIKSAWTYIVAGILAVTAGVLLLIPEQSKPVVKAVRPEVAEAKEIDGNTVNQPQIGSSSPMRTTTTAEVQIQHQAQPLLIAVPKANTGGDNKSSASVEVTSIQPTPTNSTPQEERKNRMVVEEQQTVVAPPCGRNLKVTATRSETDNSWMFTPVNAPVGAYLSWNFGDGESGSGNPGSHIYPDMNAEYQVKVLVFRAANCIDSGICRVATRQRHPGLSIPDVFTPNGDGINDFLEITLPSVTQFNQVVTDKNGKQLFVSNNPAIRWDGKSASVDCQPGTYRITITYKTPQAAKAVSFTKLILLNR